MSKSPRQSWLDEKSQTPLIDDYAQKMSTFVAAMADGHINQQELDDQERRLAEALKEVEPKLNDEQHAAVTKLLCELTAYNIMQTFHSLQAARPRRTLRL